MKKTITKSTIIACLMALFSFNSFAQKNFYVKLGGGYNFGAASENNYIYNETGTVTNYEKVNLAFGKGLSFGGSFGYNFNKYFGTELNVSYLSGASNQFSNTTNNSTSNGKENFDYSATMLSFSPSFLITPGFEKINPYARIGLIIGLPTVTLKIENSGTFMGMSSSANGKFVMNGGIALGSQSAFGIDYKINDQFSLFGEFNIVNLSYSPKKGELTESKVNGVDNLSNLTTREKKTDYVDSYNEDSSVAPDSNAPQKSIKPNLPFSSIGLNVGVVFHF